MSFSILRRISLWLKASNRQTLWTSLWSNFFFCKIPAPTSVWVSRPWVSSSQINITLNFYANYWNIKIQIYRRCWLKIFNESKLTYEAILISRNGEYCKHYHMAGITHQDTAQYSSGDLIGIFRHVPEVTTFLFKLYYNNFQ